MNYSNPTRIGERFQRMVIGDEDYQATFPFVEQIDHQIVRRLAETGVEVTDYTNRQRVLEFAGL